MVEDLERKRAEFAYQQLQAYGKLGQKAASEWLPGLPVMLRNQGLLITLATLHADGAQELVETIEQWLTSKAPHRVLPSTPSDNKEGFVRRCMSADRTSYLAAQWEAIELVQAMKVMHRLVGESRG